MTLLLPLHPHEPGPHPTSAAADWAPPGLPGARSGDAWSEQVRLSLRLVVHLGYAPADAIDRVESDWASQHAISVALGATQGAVSKVLQRLESVGIVRRERRRARGRFRRIQSFHLTPSGEALAREIRERFGLPRAPSPAVQQSRNAVIWRD
ncbi:MAG: hypothetical protein L3K17_05665 [Thermoplasmata archaeon]|nr:hypothetical protein [Thermoplasmata archaeon]